MIQSLFIYAPKIIFDFVFDILYFIPWWYSKGLVLVVGNLWRFLVRKERELAVLVWIVNIHKPLFNEYNLVGRVKSIALRVVQIIWRTFLLLIWTVIILSAIILYLVAVPLAFWQIVFQLI